MLPVVIIDNEKIILNLSFILIYIDHTTIVVCRGNSALKKLSIGHFEGFIGQYLGSRVKNVLLVKKMGCPQSDMSQTAWDKENMTR